MGREKVGNTATVKLEFGQVEDGSEEKKKVLNKNRDEPNQGVVIHWPTRACPTVVLGPSISSPSRSALRRVNQFPHSACPPLQ
ncbi:hypothetical protein RirG_031700 [Rhizophagus irregularis DAOM 197198w]|uniref:Uncharacterized protein n=1 Tax=Rhizophagus irregularis (strain DAOM 197198w) TaxID=1432141 RepID=A0A015LV86_RHIIW|nr:hypothetical protein RirG_031700 [Rhizophagus irregularis DAOM 197198w]